MTKDPLIGLQLDEYRLECLLGQGGMARVYRGLDVNLNRSAAIKVIDMPHRADDEYAKRFKREAQAIARLDHPHIVRLYRYGELTAGPAGDQLLYMAMQFIKGADLQYVLTSYRKDGELIETREAARIIREVCTALDYAHASGVIHRDVKPDNIMLDWEGRAVVTDFGLALLSTQATRGEIFGSPQYISPEQAVSSAKAVPQSDLYAVGVILYEMFTGCLPFLAKMPLDLVMMHINDPVPSPRGIRPEISQELESVMLRALAKRPEDRYPTGQALSVAVDKALLGENPDIPAIRKTIPQRASMGLTGQERLVSITRNDTPATRKSVVPNLVLGIEAAPHAENLLKEGPPVRSAAVEVDPPNVASGVHPLPRIPIAVSPMPGRPHAQNENNRSWILAGLGSLLVILLCLSGSALILVNQILAGSTEDPVASTALGKKPTASSGVTFPTAAPDLNQAALNEGPALTPGSSPTTSTPYHLQISRQGEDKGTMLLINTGSADIPISELSLQAEQDQLSASTWNVGPLSPGGCLVARKEEHKRGDLPVDVDCQPVGPTVIVPNSMDGVFKDKLSVYYRDQLIGTCEREQFRCPFTFSD